MDKNLGCYGIVAKPMEVQNWIFNNMTANIKRQDSGMPRSTLSIWGMPGISKTSIVKQLANRKYMFNGVEQAIKVVDIPLAQIEEMGDILGYPVEEIKVRKADTQLWIKAVNEVIKSYVEKGWELTSEQRTTYAPPSWVPTEECPGIILFDDGNRASQRIMKGLMQLVQDYRTIGWAIPRGWTIVFTGNPDNRMNQVTGMDTAQLTRMKHITLECDAQEWATWAANNNVDPRGINFVLKYPEMMIGSKRTNPRSLTEFFYSLSDYTDLGDKEQFRACMIDANASLDEETVETMMTFLTRENELIIEPQDILDDTDNAIEKLNDLMSRKEPRIDIISVIMDRFLAYIFSNKYEFKEEHVTAFQKWVQAKANPRDIVYSALNRIITNANFKYGRKMCSGNDMMSMILEMYKKF